MKIFNDISQISARKKRVVLAIGTFDGVHAGHREVVQTALESARSFGGEVWVLTFDPHPLRVLRPEIAPPLLTSLAHKLRLLEALGVDGCIVVEFTPEFAAINPRDFLRLLRKEAPDIAEIVVGENWQFGRGSAGDIDMMRDESGHYGYQLTVAAPVLWKGEQISSTRIRRAVMDGNLEDAKRMLGRPFSILGEVEEGRHIGRDMGFPTANISSRGEVVPPQGIYAVYTVINGKRHDGAAYYGTRPSFPDSKHDPILEVHLFDGLFDLYSHEIEVFFVRFLREDRKYENIEELREQIHRDCEDARSALRKADLQL